ncbi:MAG: phosphatidate cytidylyltransferase, partial [Limnochordia bacterium]
MFQRIITALIGIPIILTAINWGGPWLLALLALITLVASGELNTLWRKAGYEPLAEVVLLGGLILLLGSYIGWGQHVIILLTLYTLTRETFRGSSLKNGPPAIFSVLYTGGCLGYIAALRGEMGAGAVFLLLITIWCTDTTAYFYGTYRGKRPLCPQISPKKTWEGAGAATLVAAGLASLSGPVLVGIGPGQAL